MAKGTKERIVLAGGLLGYPSMKQEQVDMARVFLEGKDVFAVLPTGFGKSLHVLCMPACLHVLCIIMSQNITHLTSSLSKNLRKVLRELSFRT